MASADKGQLGADLSAYLDGELSPQRARRVERLLEESQDARHLLAELRAVSRDLGDLPRMHAPEGLVERIRHAAKRWVASPPRRVPASGVRVLRLVTRVAASAAVIVVCVSAGWLMRDRVAPRAPAASDFVTREAPLAKKRAAETFAHRAQSEKSAPADVAVMEAPAVAMRDLESLGYVAADAYVETESRPPAPAAEALVAAGRPSPETERSAFAFETALAADDAFPIVDVVVAPQDANQFDDALQLAAAWQQESPMIGGQLATGWGVARRTGRGGVPTQLKDKEKGAKVAAPSQREFIVQVPAARVTEMLQSLERQVPRQVHVVMTPDDLSWVQRMAVPAGTSGLSDQLQVADSEPVSQESARALARAEAPAGGRGIVLSETDVPESRRIGRGGGRGRVTRQPVQPEDGVSAPEKAAEQREAAAAGIAWERLREETAEMSLSPGRVGDEGAVMKGQAAPEAKKEALAETGTPMSDARSPRVADVARPTSETIMQRVSGVDGAAESTAAGALVLEQPGEFREHLEGVYETMLDAVEHSVTSARPEPERGDRGSVTLRVKVLPPPQTTQPASATSSPEAP